MKRLAVFGFLFVALTFFSLSCQKELSQESNLNNATFSLHDDSSKACYPVSISGDYYNGVSARDINFITVVVNVKSTGNYTLSSNTKNGFYFVDSGFFSKTGLDTLVLKAKGTPILVQTDDFIFPADSLGSCGFSIDVKDSTGTGLGGGVDSIAIDTSYQDANPASDSAWHFTDSISGKTYSGKLPKGETTIQDDNGIKTFELIGYTDDLTKAFGFDIDLPSGVITPGIYEIKNDNTLGLLDVATQDDIYFSDADAAELGNSYSYIRISTYDDVSKHATGVFHCWAEDADGKLALLKGSYNVYF